MNVEQLRARVYSLSERSSWLGMGADIAHMTVVELEAALRFLMRLAESEGCKQ